MYSRARKVEWYRYFGTLSRWRFSISYYLHCRSHEVVEHVLSTRLVGSSSTFKSSTLTTLVVLFERGV